MGIRHPQKRAKPPIYGPCLVAKWLYISGYHFVGLGPGDFVFDGSQLPLKKGRSPTQFFGPCLLWPNGWMDEDATRYGSRPQPRPHCVRWGLSSPPGKGTSAPPLFGPCPLWPRLPISATAELLYSHYTCQLVVDGTLS